MTYVVKATSSPNNEIRITLYPVRRKRTTENCDEDSGSASSSAGFVPNGECSGAFLPESPILDIRSEFRTKCNAHEYARTHFGKNACTRIYHAAGALDKNDAEKSHYLFLTATLPGDDEWCKWAIAENSHLIVDRLKSWLSKRLNSRMEFYVWEHQKREALHIHWCLYCPDDSMRQNIKDGFKAQWMRLLDGIEMEKGYSIWGRHEKLSWEDKYSILQTQAVEVYSGVAQYMASYLGGENCKHANDGKIPYYPKRWFGISRPLSELIKNYTKTFQVEDYSYRKTKILFDDLSKKIEDFSDSSVNFRHTVGVGETTAAYFQPEIQELAWQELNPMVYKNQTHPVIASYLRTVQSIVSICQDLETQSGWYRVFSEKHSISVLADSTFYTSPTRGTMNLATHLAVKSLYFALFSLPHYPRTLKPLEKALKHWVTMYTLYKNTMIWDRHGWLCNCEDFPSAIDMLCEIGEYRTTSQTDDDATGLDGYSPHVGSELMPLSLQLSLLD